MTNKLETVFNDFDRDKSGYIEISDLMEVLYGEEAIELDKSAW
jgi:Ca2+-binding EF-hand superfamily protein